MDDDDDTITLRTSKNRRVINGHGADLPLKDIESLMKWADPWPLAERRTEPSAVFNCHGLTFASRRTQVVKSPEISKILEDDAWHQLGDGEERPGDVVIYYDDDGDAAHSGVIVRIEEIEGIKMPWIFSKWGKGCEYVHRLRDVPDYYGSDRRFFRCRL